MEESNLQKLISSIKAFGFGSLRLEVDDFSDPENIIQLGYEPHRIDLLVDVNGLNFEACYQRKSTAELDDIEVDFLSLKDLITAKRNTGRLQDLADAEQLEKLNRKNEG